MPPAVAADAAGVALVGAGWAGVDVVAPPPNRDEAGFVAVEVEEA